MCVDGCAALGELLERGGAVDDVLHALHLGRRAAALELLLEREPGHWCVLVCACARFENLRHSPSVTCSQRPCRSVAKSFALKAKRERADAHKQICIQYCNHGKHAKCN